MSLAWRQDHAKTIPPPESLPQYRAPIVNFPKSGERKWASEVTRSEPLKYSEKKEVQRERAFSSKIIQGEADRGRTLTRAVMYRAPPHRGELLTLSPNIKALKEERIQRAIIALKVQDRRVVSYALREIFALVDSSPAITSADEFMRHVFIDREDIQPVTIRNVSDLLLAIIPDSTNSKVEIQKTLLEIMRELGVSTEGQTIDEPLINDKPTFDNLTNERNPEL